MTSQMMTLGVRLDAAKSILNSHVSITRHRLSILNVPTIVGTDL